jgi:hypothetical protein
MAMTEIKNQKLLYHLTSIDNVKSIFTKGLQPRADLKTFEDVADQDIISSRKNLSLENYVPFHWFARNPFDGRVQADRPDDLFALITIRRTFAASHNWKIIPRHPLAAANIDLMDYEPGFAAIDWEAMDRREYLDPHSKSVCMAECLSPTPVSPENFFSIYVCCDDSATYLEAQKKTHSVRVDIKVNKSQSRKSVDMAHSAS